MGKFIFELPDNMAVLIEAFRVKRGHKATAVAVRELIAAGLALAAGEPGWASPARIEVIGKATNEFLADLPMKPHDGPFVYEQKTKLPEFSFKPLSSMGGKPRLKGKAL